MNDVSSLMELAETMHGVFTAAHARGAGMSMRQIDHRLRTGAWVSIFESCYRVAGAPLTWEGRLLAACWAGGFRAVASHRSAAALWELPGGRQTPSEITCPRWRRARHASVIVHETNALEDTDRTFVEGIPVTSVERTLLDLAAVTRDATVEMALDSAERRGLTTPRHVRALVVRLSRPGRRGVRRLRRILDLRAPEDGPTETEAEALLLRVLRRHGFPRPAVQFVVRDGQRFVGRVDAAYAEERIAIEYESYEWHTGRIAVERDNARRNALQAVEWAYIGATWRDIRTGGHTLARDLRRIRALRRR